MHVLEQTWARALKPKGGLRRCAGRECRVCQGGASMSLQMPKAGLVAPLCLQPASLSECGCRTCSQAVHKGSL